MAFASTLQKGQIPVGCEICQGKNKIEFKCLDCNLLMCSGCKDRVHLRIAKDHQITDIKDIGKRVIFSEIKCVNHAGQSCCLFCQTCKSFICLKCVAQVHNGHTLIEEEDYTKACKGQEELIPTQKSIIKLEVSKIYTTDLTSIHYIAVCSDGSMWIGDGIRSTLQHVKLRANGTDCIKSLDIGIYGMAKTHSNNILVTANETKLKSINFLTGQLKESRFDIQPLLAISIHVTSDHRVVIGAWSGDKIFPVTGKRVVVVMDQEGKQLEKYEYDKNKKQLFTFPRYITSTVKGDICVEDQLKEDNIGRVVVLAPGGDILWIYTGNPNVNTEKDPFRPVGILTTPSDNIIVTDLYINLLHILTNQGQIITYYNLRDIGIIYPCCIALSSSGTIYIGCVSAVGSSDTQKNKLYELEYSGF